MGDLWRPRNVSEIGLILEVVVAVTARVTVTNTPSPSVGIGHKIEHMLHHTLVILALEPTCPRAATVALALGRNVKLPAMTPGRLRVIIPHELVDIHKR